MPHNEAQAIHKLLKLHLIHRYVLLCHVPPILYNCK